MEVNFASMEKLSEYGKSRKNVVVFIVKNLDKTKSTTTLEDGIKNFLEKKIWRVFSFDWTKENM
jgi:hypothetical protein